MNWLATLPLLLAQGRARSLSDQDRADIFFWLIVLVAIGFALGIGGYLVFRKLRSANQPAGDYAGFSLSQMRRLYEAGEISHEEYTQVRERILAAAKRSMLDTETIATSSPENRAPPVTPRPSSSNPTGLVMDDAAGDDAAAQPEGGDSSENENSGPRTPGAPSAMPADPWSPPKGDELGSPGEAAEDDAGENGGEGADERRRTAGDEEGGGDGAGRSPGT